MIVITLALKAIQSIIVKTQSPDSKSQVMSYKEKNEQFEDKKIRLISILQ